MTRSHPTDPSTDPLHVDQALRELLAPAAKPRLRAGFDRRLARAVAVDAEKRRRSRTLRRVLRVYWLGSAVASAAILWQFQDRLLSGPGLWIGIATLVTLVGAGLSLSVLAALPVRLGSRGQATP